MSRAATKDKGRERLARIGLAPRGLELAEAAAYIGIAPGTFEALVARGIMPSARVIGGRRVWDRLEVDRDFDNLPHASGQRGATTEPDDVFARART